VFGDTGQVSTFGTRLKAARLGKGYTQDELSDLLGVTKSAVSAWENDRETPAFDKLASIHRALEASIDELVFGESRHDWRVGEGPMRYPLPPPRDAPRTPEERTLLRRFRTLPDRKRRGLLGLLADDQLAESAATAAGRSSQDLSPADLSMAVQLANEKIASAGLAPTQEQYGEFVLLLHDLLVDGLPTADVHDIRSGKLLHSTSGDRHVGTEVQATRESPGAAVPAVHHAGKAGRKR
jgi:transcriptional regulator with XRE-family HTH domain